MPIEENIKKLEALVSQVEGYVNNGAWESHQQEEIEVTITQADAVFNQIITDYITKIDVPPVQQAYQVSDLQERLHRAKHNLPFPPSKQEDEGKKMADKKVVIYTTPTCPWCRRAKQYLAQKGIAYLEHNVAQDKDKAREMIEKSGQMGVPVITIDGEVIVGFDQGRLDSLLS